MRLYLLIPPVYVFEPRHLEIASLASVKLFNSFVYFFILLLLSLFCLVYFFLSLTSLFAFLSSFLIWPICPFLNSFISSIFSMFSSIFFSSLSIFRFKPLIGPLISFEIGHFHENSQCRQLELKFFL